LALQKKRNLGQNGAAMHNTRFHDDDDAALLLLLLLLPMAMSLINASPTL
jgi:hypothetical protein